MQIYSWTMMEKEINREAWNPLMKYLNIQCSQRNLGSIVARAHQLKESIFAEY